MITAIRPVNITGKIQICQAYFYFYKANKFDEHNNADRELVCVIRSSKNKKANRTTVITVMVKFQDETSETQRTIAWDKDTKFLSETAPGKPDIPSKVSAIKPGSKIYTLMTDRSSNGKTFWFQEVTLLK